MLQKFMNLFRSPLKVNEKTNLGSEYREYAIEPVKTTTVEIHPNGLYLDLGRLKVVQEPDGTDKPRVGFGTKVFLDGKELDKIKSVSLHIEAGDVVVAKLEVLG